MSMRLTGARRVAERGAERAADRAAGAGRTPIRLSARQAVATTIPNVHKLPVQPNTTLLQNSSGQYLILSNYSDPAGSDVSS